MPYTNSHMDTVAFRDFERDINTITRQIKKEIYVESYPKRYIDSVSGLTQAEKIKNIITKKINDTGCEFVSLSTFSDDSVLVTYRK